MTVCHHDIFTCMFILKREEDRDKCCVLVVSESVLASCMYASNKKNTGE